MEVVAKNQADAGVPVNGESERDGGKVIFQTDVAECTCQKVAGVVVFTLVS